MTAQVNDKSLNDVLVQAMRQNAISINKVSIGFIVDFDHTKLSASVQVGVETKLNDGRVLSPPPIIENVPVLFQNTATMSMTFKISKGDTVLLLFFDKNVENFLLNGNIAPPAGNELHSINQAVCIPNIMPFNRPSPMANNEDTVIKTKGNVFRQKPNGETEIEALKVHITSPDTFINGNLTVSQNLNFLGQGGGTTATMTGNFTLNGSLAATGDISAGGVSLTTHTHGGVQAGGSNTGVPN